MSKDWANLFARKAHCWLELPRLIVCFVYAIIRQTWVPKCISKLILAVAWFFNFQFEMLTFVIFIRCCKLFAANGRTTFFCYILQENTSVNTHLGLAFQHMVLPSAQYQPCEDNWIQKHFLRILSCWMMKKRGY